MSSLAAQRTLERNISFGQKFSSLNAAIDVELGISREEAIAKLDACLASVTECCRTFVDQASDQPGCPGHVARTVQSECRNALVCLRNHLFLNRRYFLLVFVKLRSVERWLGRPETVWPLKPTVRVEKERRELGDVFTPLVTLWPTQDMLSLAMAATTDEYVSRDPPDWEEELVNDSASSSRYGEWDNCEVKEASEDDSEEFGEAQDMAGRVTTHSLVAAFQSLNMHEGIVQDGSGEELHHTSNTRPLCAEAISPSGTTGMLSNQSDSASPANLACENETDAVLVTRPQTPTIPPPMSSLRVMRSTDQGTDTQPKIGLVMQRLKAKIDKIRRRGTARKSKPRD